jgi:uncharacterized membrane-anchored protein YhcB (DUF1043 family)
MLNKIFRWLLAIVGLVVGFTVTNIVSKLDLLPSSEFNPIRSA